METSKQMKKDQSLKSTLIELDKDEIKQSIEKSGVYKSQGVSIKSWEGDKDSEFYLSSITLGNNSYKGIVNTILKRENYGINSYDNGDLYFGKFQNDMKNEHGVYFFSPSTNHGHILSEIYFGFWRDNQKDKRGIYIWLKEKQSAVESFDTTDFDAFVGDMEGDSHKRGCYLSKIGDSLYVYYGSFDKDGLKNDEKAYFFDNVKNRIFMGKIIKDKFINGYMLSYNDDDTLKNIIYVEFDDNDTPIKILPTEEIEVQKKDNVIASVKAFRDYMISDDHFSIVYTKMKNIKNFVQDDMKDNNILNMIDSEDFSKLMNIGCSYNDVKLYKNLEKIMSDYK